MPWTASQLEIHVHDITKQGSNSEHIGWQDQGNPSLPGFQNPMFYSLYSTKICCNFVAYGVAIILTISESLEKWMSPWNLGNPGKIKQHERSPDYVPPLTFRPWGRGRGGTGDTLDATKFFQFFISKNWIWAENLCTPQHMPGASNHLPLPMNSRAYRQKDIPYMSALQLVVSVDVTWQYLQLPYLCTAFNWACTALLNPSPTTSETRKHQNGWSSFSL